MTTHPPIIGLGMASLDVLIRLKDMPTWEHGARLNAMAIEGGGPTATAIVAAARLGVPVGFIGTYGNDRLGQIKLQTLLEYGLDLSHAIQRPGPDDQVVLVHVHAETGERIFSGIQYAQRRPLTPDELDRDYITAADYLHVDGMHADAALVAARWMHEAGKTVMLDGTATRGPVSEKMRVLVGVADILICGTGFGPALTGLSDLWDVGAAILDMGPRIVVQTEGKDGSYTVTRDERFHVPAFEVEVVDTTGAGDVFHGAYLVGLRHGWDLHTTTVFSTAVSAIKCTQLSGRRGIPTFDETLAFLQQRGIDLVKRQTSNVMP